MPPPTLSTAIQKPSSASVIGASSVDPRQAIFRHIGGLALGDTWNLAQWVKALSTQIQQPLKLSTHFPERDGGPAQAMDLLPRCMRLMQGQGSFEWAWGHNMRPLPLAHTTPIDQRWLWDPARVAYTPTVRRWDGAGVHLCYQFDGRSGSSAKNPPAADEARLIAALGPHAVRVGLPHTLEASIELLATCRLFVGVCSGMSHVAHSVGCPRIVIQYQQPVYHWQPAPSRDFSIAYGTEDAIMLIGQRVMPTAASSLPDPGSRRSA